MAHLSDFLHQIHAYTGDWVALELGQDRRMVPSPCADVLFYVILQGDVSISLRPGRSFQLRPSDVAMVFSGVGHVFETGKPTTQTPFEHFEQHHDFDAPPLLQAGAPPAAAKLLVGKVRISWPSMLRPAALPPLLHLNMGPTEASAAEIINLFARARIGPGASAYLTKVAELAMLRTLRENVELLRQLPPDAASLQIARSLKLIESAPGQDWTVARLAREIGMSRSSFAEKFMQYTGRSPMDAVTDARMRLAAELLDCEPASLAEISRRTGYRSEAAFSRRFERHFGATPGRYRKLSQESRLAIWPGLRGKTEPADIPALP